MSNHQKMGKRRENRETKNPSLPQEIILEIFSRMPHKSIGKCKVLSKTWLSLVSTKEFLKLCLNHDQANLILINPDHSLHLLLSSPLIDNQAVSRKLDFPGSWTEVVGSCNGLVLLTNKEGELFLINPFSDTDNILKIPGLHLYEKEKRTNGFGFDASSNDYKIVTLSFDPDEILKTSVDVFSVKKGVWKRCGVLPFRLYLMPVDDPLVSGVYVNGAIHWKTTGKFSSSLTCTVIKFDLAKEVFHDMHITDSGDSPVFVGMSLVDRGGRLCMVSSNPNILPTFKKVWTMEDYWLAESWRKTTICENDGTLCFLGQEAALLREKDGCVFVYDVKKKTVKEFVVDGVPAGCVYLGNFVDSLA